MQRTGGALERTGGAKDRTGVASQRTGDPPDRTGGAIERSRHVLLLEPAAAQTAGPLTRLPKISNTCYTHKMRDNSKYIKRTQ